MGGDGNRVRSGKQFNLEARGSGGTIDFCLSGRSDRPLDRFVWQLLMLTNKTTFILLVFTAFMLYLSACSLAGAPANGDGLKQEQDSLPSPTSALATSPAEEPLPPPVVVTLPAEDFEMPDSSQLDTLEADSIIQAAAALPLDVQLLIDEIQRGEYQFDQPADPALGIQATYTYSDVDGDGIEDLIIIVLAEQGGLTSVSAGSLPGSPEILLAPLPGSEKSLQTMSIPAETLIELAVANGINQKGAIILTLTGTPPE